MIRSAYRTYFGSQPAAVRWAMLLTMSVFLPYFVAVPMILAAVAYVLVSPARMRRLLENRPAWLLLPLGLVVLIVPLCYRNGPGFFTGLGAVMLVTLALSLGRSAGVGLLDRVCALSCGMSLLDAAAALVEKCVSSSALRPFYYAGLGIFDARNDPQVRAVGLTYNANLYAILIEFVVLMAFYRLLSGGRKAFYIPVVAVNAMALFATDCRSGWAPILAGLLVLFALRGKKVAGIAVVTLGGLTGLFFAAVGLFPSLLPRFFHFGKAASERAVVWNISWNDFLKHPVFGHGMLANLQITKNWYVPHAHNLALDVMQSTGTVGALLLLGYFVVVMAELVRGFRAGNRRQRAACSLEFAVLAALMIHGITDIPVIGIQSGLFFLLILGLRPVARLRTLRPPVFSQPGHAEGRPAVSAARADPKRVGQIKK